MLGGFSASPDLARVREDWELLAEKVQRFDPTVVVLIARKPVRMFQVLGIEPAPGALVVSDLAIPFMVDFLAGARVAVVDDVVNVGSTLRRICRLVEEAGAGTTKAFAISRVEREVSLPDLDVVYSGTVGIDTHDLRQLGRRVPKALQSQSKPYDLTFPIMEREVLAPFDSFENLLAAMRARYGEQYVYDLSTPAGTASGMRRCAVDLSDDEELRKVNLYFDEAAGTCTLVPIAITPVLNPKAPALHPTPWAAAVWEGLSGLPSGTDPEPLCRLGLFVDALTVGESFAAEHGCVLRLRGERPFSGRDAELAMGPAVGRVRPHGDDHLLPNFRSVRNEDLPVTSPFLEEARKQGFIEAVEAETRGLDTLSVFMTCFEELGRRIGANEPSEYSFGWPYTHAEVQEEPYLRLRIGPSLSDLVVIVDTITKTGDLVLTRRRVTRLLDRYIDTGGVVPTVATYGESVYRIYRQGESFSREDVSQRVRFAWQCYKKPLSLTRATKYLTILAFDQPQNADSQVEVETARRGNTLCFSDSVLDDRTEVAEYLRNTNQIRPAD
jgi:hypothetical protein